ncbi:DEAD-box ATP-dependent RNA helicase 5 [Rhododendron vialii]|uniref:DEAD-box ATP-dependent RNA helicase 5 n=1 Tax=Rhododendron vialii TaxID=182163 RepID=UPI00265DA3C7|nr:DEAD-box ATP-dependent RNA helicase 5 [Rhododendron vialii]
MAKGDDALRRKKNKLNRKKQRADVSATVSNRIAAIIAAKKRRLTGKRRNCQGMCFSLPTPENPFNDKYEKRDIKGKETKKPVPSKADCKVAINGNSVASKKGTLGRNHVSTDHHQQQETVKGNNWWDDPTMSLKSINNMGKKNVVKQVKEQDFEQSGCPSKFLALCLNSVQNAMRHNGFSAEEDKPLFIDKWGVEFWKCYSVGKDILETSGACSTIEQIAWIASTATDSIARKEKEGLSLTGPFLLFLVPSQEKAIKVRTVCKSLKGHGIHTASLHTGTSIDHQIHGLKSIEPEFLVSTPERLLELVSLKAIDISGVSLLVVDGLETLIKGGHGDVIKYIRQHISTNPHTVVFSDCSSSASIPLVQNLLCGSIRRLSLNNSISSQGACILQSIHVCASEEEKILKGIQVLDQACGDQPNLQLSKVLFVVGNDSNFNPLVTAIESKGYSVAVNSAPGSEIKNRKRRPAVLISKVEHINTSDFGGFELVIISDFVHSIVDYVQILTRMARHTVSGALHSFLTTENATLIEQLIEILERCGQAVPGAVRNLCQSISMVEG